MRIRRLESATVSKAVDRAEDHIHRDGVSTGVAQTRFPRKAAPVDLRLIKRPLKQTTEDTPSKRRRVDEANAASPQASRRNKASPKDQLPVRPRGRPRGSKNKKTIIKEQEALLLERDSRNTARPVRLQTKQPDTYKRPTPPAKPKNKVGRKKKIPDPSLSPSTAPIVEDHLHTFGNRLTIEEAETERAAPTAKSKDRYERAKEIAEDIERANNVKIATRTKKLSRKNKPLSSSSHRPHHQSDHVEQKIHQIRIGDYLIDTWYNAPYPEEYSKRPILYICEYCLKYIKSEYTANRHKLKCMVKHPPGDEIYRDGIVSIFEVDGRKNKIYCQNLCLLAKMFLDHKTLYYDVEPFLFYIMTEVDSEGCHFVGYFSKEKRSLLDYNLSCIMTLPSHQRKGYGNLLVDISYLLSRKEGKPGSPEKPLSDLGMLSYRAYWKTCIFRQLIQVKDSISIQELSSKTGMTFDDVIATLQLNHLLKKDEHGQYFLDTNETLIKTHLDRVVAKGYPYAQADKLTWAPFLIAKTALGMLNVVRDGSSPTTATAQKENEAPEQHKKKSPRRK